MSSSATARALETIELAKHERATSLDLHAFGLKDLPPFPAELRSLREANLSINRLTGLPPDFWQLTQLQRLDLGSNRLAEIAPGVQNLNELRLLDVSENRLTTLPRELCACLGLTELYAYGNQLAEVPEQIANLNRLVRIDLSANCLQQLAFPRSTFQHLEELNLSNNRLENLPREIEGLENLRVLNLSGNRLTSVDALVALTKLRELCVDDNLLANVPEKLAQLPSLKLISAVRNQFEELSAAFDKVSVLKLKKDAAAAVHQHTSGGPEPGKKHFLAPPYILDFFLAIGGFAGVVRVINLYYQRVRVHAAVTLKFPDGSTVQLENLSRKAALEAVREHERSLGEGGAKATFNLHGAQDTSELQAKTDLAVQALSRVAQAELVPRDGQPIQFVNNNFYGNVENSKFEISNKKENVMGDNISVGSIVGSNVNIKSHLKNVRQNIGAASTIDQSTKAQLDHLIQQLSENLAKAPAEKAADAEAVALAANELVAKATKEQPNKKSVEISGKGLLEAAEGVASVVPIALQIVNMVSKFITGV